MRYLSLFALVCLLPLIGSAQVIDLSGGEYESGLSANVKTYYDARAKDFLIGNPGTTTLSNDNLNFFNFFVDVPKTAVRSYTSAEVCYDSFAYVPTRANSAGFEIPAKSTTNARRLGFADTWVGQVRFSKPRKDKPGFFVVIQDFPLNRPKKAAQICTTVNMTTAHTNQGSRVYLNKLTIAPQQVLRIDKIRLF